MEQYDNLPTVPVIGMPATISIGSDSYAAKVVHVSPSAAYCMVQYVSEGGLDGQVVRFNRTGARAGGRYVHARHYWLHLGKAETYRDPSF